MDTNFFSIHIVFVLLESIFKISKRLRRFGDVDSRFLLDYPSYRGHTIFQYDTLPWHSFIIASFYWNSSWIYTQCDDFPIFG